MQKTAYGFLGLRPWEFWRLTPKQFQLMVEGYQEREEVEQMKRAQLAAWIIQPHLRKTITAEMLLQKKQTDEDVEASIQVYEQAPDTIVR